MKTPKHSYRFGFTDEGISLILKNTPGFKYSERFLKWWYTEMGNEITGRKCHASRNDKRKA